MSDTDWWVVSFSQEGMATFYLGSIPANCDYDIELYKNDVKIAYSSTSSNEHIRCHVYPNVDYKIKILTFAQYSTSDSYLFRAKVYGLREAKIFTTDTNASNINTRPDASAIIPSIWAMGFGATEYLNNSAGPAYNAMPNADIYVTSNHGSPGCLYFNNSYIYGANSGMGSNDRSIENYSSNQLSEVDLVIYSNCESAADHSSRKNLVIETRSKGAFVCIGFKGTIYVNVANYWLDKFFEACQSGKTVADAMAVADVALKNNSTYNSYCSSMEDRLPSSIGYNSVYSDYSDGLLLK